MAAAVLRNNWPSEAPPTPPRSQLKMQTRNRTSSRTDVVKTQTLTQKDPEGADGVEKDQSQRRSSCRPAACTGQKGGGQTSLRLLRRIVARTPTKHHE